MKPDGHLLVRHARDAVRAALGGPEPDHVDAPWAHVPAATFVTLRWVTGDLQGCVGRLEAERPLLVDVHANAVAAATLDPRATELTLADVDLLDVELSILSALEPLVVADEAEAVAALRPFVDGVVLAFERRRATFLPSMWPVLRDPARMVAELKRKAGIPSDFWADDIRVLRYTVDGFVDPAPSRASASAAPPEDPPPS